MLRTTYWSVSILLFVGGAFFINKLQKSFPDRMRYFGFATLAMSVGACVLSVLTRKDFHFANIVVDAVWPFGIACALLILTGLVRPVSNKLVVVPAILLVLLPGALHATLIRTSDHWQQLFFGFWVHYGGIAW